MSAWLEQLSPDRRADLVQLWMELGRALMGEASDHSRDVTKMVPAAPEQEPLPSITESVPEPATTPEPIEEPASKGPKRKYEWVTDDRKARLFELFDEGLGAMKAHKRLCDENPDDIGFTYKTTYYWLCKWKEARKAENRPNPAKQAPSVPEPT